MDMSHSFGGKSESSERRCCSSANLMTVSNKTLPLSLPRLSFTVLSACLSLNEAHSEKTGLFLPDKALWNNKRR